MSDIIKTYDRIAQDFASTRTPAFYDEEFKTFQKLLPKGKIIDIACGSGRDTKYFMTEGHEYVGIDGSKEMLKIAKNNNPDAKFQQMDFQHLDFPDKYFDGFWAATAYLHLPKKDLGAALKELARVTSPKAIGLISMKETGKSWEGEVTEERFTGKTITRYFSYYTVEEFTDVLEKAGFKVINSYVKKADGKDWQIYFVKKA